MQHATADFYYDGGDDFAPFGNDTGSDLLRNIEEWYRERRAGDKSVTWLRNLIKAWGFDTAYLDCVEQGQIEAIKYTEHYSSSNEVLDQAVIATVFGQFKIAGKADKEIYNMATNAFRRQRHLANLAKEETQWNLYDEYVAKLNIMEADLAEMANKKAR
ncbi:hypothetical protein BEN49_15545 [Hymenobacter coccineus]|uniref:Uncharacterized protein n=1 Tax=Hymenobacter coccineus TaxID=1908235 RepID=A0A1G1SRX7_9BACT|nr:hypothetical protein BEN49_15545 [Hymenobacter coccineus]